MKDKIQHPSDSCGVRQSFAEGPGSQPQACTDDLETNFWDQLSEEFRPKSSQLWWCYNSILRFTYILIRISIV